MSQNCREWKATVLPNFNSYEDIDHFILQEAEFFKDVFPGDPHRAENWYSELRQISQDRQIPFEDQSMKINTCGKKISQNDNTILSTEPAGILLKRLSENEKDKETVNYVYEYLTCAVQTSHSLVRANVKAIAVCVAIIFKNMLLQNNPDNIDLFKDILKELQRDIESQRGGFQRLIKDIIDAEKNIDDGNKRFDQQLKQQSDQFNDFLRSNNQSFEDQKKYFAESLALQAPVTYWQNRGKTHKHLSWLFGGLWFLAIVLSSGLVFLEIYSLYSIPNDHPTLYSEPIIALIATATIGIFVLRTLGKLMLSNVHLMNSSQEKATMTNTYLALLQEGKAFTDKDRSLVLEALFRPTMTGLIQGEELPTSSTDALLKLFTKP
ncbi:MAG TPA: DUF6161 domain-containing protein [Candidatus Hydrogenedentes bacterium]|nr:DUF6161 domain-containing protein [Candidatus Hydrogenedentota bacterium]